MNSLFCKMKQNFQEKVKPNKCTVQSLEHESRVYTYSSKGLEIPCQNTFKDKPAFIKRLIKVLVARELFSVHSSSCKNNGLATTWKLRFHLWIYYNASSNWTQEIQFLEFIGGSNVLQAFPNYFICLRFIRISTVYCIIIQLSTSASLA